jgi:hypothetical protein
MRGLADLFTSSPATGIGIRAGELTGWEQTTGENVVLVAGTSVRNVPVLFTTDLPDLTVGDKVHLLRVGNQYGIIGKFLQPPI